MDEETKRLIEKAVLAERNACADLIHAIGYTHTASLSQFVANEFLKAEKAIRDRGRGDAL